MVPLVASLWVWVTLSKPHDGRPLCWIVDGQIVLHLVLSKLAVKEDHHVAIGDDVVFAFCAEPGSFAGSGPRASS